MRVANLLVILMIVTGGLRAIPGHGQTQPESRNAIQCAELANADFSQTEDAPTQVISAKSADVQKNLPAYCEVEGYVMPNVGFLLRMPSGGWNGKYFQLGCGGFCGSAEYAGGCNDLIRRGYACLVSDNGHKSTGLDAKWAFNNLTAELDHAYRAPHVASLAGKAIVERYYRRPPQKSYFMGGSTGGRQALMEAQRFPWDFDGIIAGIPSVNVPLIYMHLLWANRALVDSNGASRLSKDDIEMLHDAVLAKCDGDDGLKDGLITDPRKCSFEPANLLCRAGKESGCLTQEQVEAVKKLYSGPVTSSGHAVYMPGPMKGSELTWLGYFRSFDEAGNDPWQIYNFAGDAFRYSAFQPAPGPKWKPENFDFDRDYKRLTQSEALYAAINPDLRRFKAAGGRLISYAGWADAIGMPLPAIDYYETVEKTMGGRSATQDFFRLFVIPGMAHGPDRSGAFVVDWVSYLEAWVEKGQAPDKIHNSRVEFKLLKESGNDTRLRAMENPVPEQELIAFTRSVYPYPIVAKYRGRGDPKDAASFRPQNPEK